MSGDFAAGQACVILDDSSWASWRNLFTGSPEILHALHAPQSCFVGHCINGLQERIITSMIRPVTAVLLQVADELEDMGDSYLSTSRAAVLADAEALLTCYGVGE